MENSNKQFSPGDRVKFIKKSLVFNKKEATQFFVEEGTEALVVEDRDQGVIGAIILKLKKPDGSTILIETNDQNIDKV